ncbi:cation diffusion facilitator family transporter [Salinisphaera sp. SPP-AMP-43]|uniref:cation diffusion facilitator family transporter n=1 Tax=Salinisphaera sp. SPP-AMP-43 TaxID=3121288 RepID=UPI003C6E1574
MAGCCSEEDAHLQALQQRQARMLWVVLLINSVMFVVEFGAGWWAGSTALLGDSLDMLGDALVYGLSLFVIGRSLRWKAVSAGVKGVIMLGFGGLVLGEAVVKALYGQAPMALSMVGIGGLALAANIVCLCLLTRHRDEDLNMRSSWVCSRNDLFANSGVILAGVLVALTGSVWPDVLIGTAIAGLFLQSSIGVLKQARQRYSDAAPTAVAGGDAETRP